MWRIADGGLEKNAVFTQIYEKEQRAGRKEQRTKSKEKRADFYLEFLLVLCLRVLVVAMRRRRISLQSDIKLSYSAEERRLVSFSKLSQYSVSAHSLSEIVVFTRNSYLLTEYWASERFAPIDVPERSICLERTNSFFSSHRCL